MSEPKELDLFDLTDPVAAEARGILIENEACAQILELQAELAREHECEGCRHAAIMFDLIAEQIRKRVRT